VLRATPDPAVFPIAVGGIVLSIPPTNDRGADPMEGLTGRQIDILSAARDSGRVSVDDLARRFDVTPQTIRKDLNDLCDRQLLSRIHGGAIVTSSVRNLSYDARRFVAAEEKRAIGRAAAALIPSGSSLFINIGTTTEEVAEALADHDQMLVITNNLNVAMQLSRRSGFEVIVAGGPVRPNDAAVVGSSAADLIRQFKVDTAVIGTSAIDEDGWLFDYDYREVRVAQAIIENARRVILVSDRTKFERTAPVRITHFDHLDVFVTDWLPSTKLRALCREKGVRVIETMPAPVGEPPSED
jgi:DeoR family glycerol-3-phosphate regulon repressor